MLNVVVRVALVMLCCISGAQAQFLANNTTLNSQSLQRWMESSRDMTAIIEAVDNMHPSAESLAVFDALSSSEQDQQINAYLEQNNLLERATLISNQHGWKSVGEYRRLGTRLGNAIAAYFFAKNIEGFSAEQVKALRDEADPVLLAVPPADVAFVKANEKILQHYIQAYSAGR